MMRAAVLLALIAGLAGAQERVPARIRAAREIEVAAEVSGRVVERLVSRSRRAEAGQVVLRIDPTFYRLAHERAEAACARADAQALLAATELERVQRLAAQGAADPATLDRHELEHAIATAGRDEARAVRDETTERLARTEVKAPEGGIVSEIHPEVGEMVVAGTSVFRLLTVDDLVAETFLEPRQTAGLAEGRRVTVVIEGSPELVLEGVIRELALATARGRTLRLVVALPPDVSAAVRAGIDAEVVLPAGPEDSRR